MHQGLRLATELTEWPAVNGERIAAVSAFGMSGTNHPRRGGDPGHPRAGRTDDHHRTARRADPGTTQRACR